MILTNYNKLKTGDWVEIFGNSVSIEKFASICDTISYEIASKIGKRVKKIYIDNFDEDKLSFINNLNNADFLVMLLILLAMLRGYLRGFVKEFLSIFSIFFSGYISIYFYPNISLFIKKYIEMGVIADIISLSILFFFIYSCFSILIKL